MSKYEIGKDVGRLEARVDRLEDRLRFGDFRTGGDRSAVSRNTGELSFYDIADGVRANRISLDQLEAENGKIGAFALFAMLLQASRYLGVPYRGIERFATAEAQTTWLVDRTDTSAPAGPFLFRPEDGPGGPSGFRELNFRNVSNERAVLILEGIDPFGRSQGYTYAQLEPGDRISYVHNLFPIVIGGVTITAAGAATGVAVVGGVVVVVGGIHDAIGAAVESIGTRACTLFTYALIRNSCSGTCAVGTRCRPTATEGWWVFGSEPGACACI